MGHAVAHRLFQITEPDLVDLEHTLPALLDRMYPHLDNRQRAQWRKVQRIITDVRWNYGPPGECEVIPADGDGPTP